MQILTVVFKFILLNVITKVVCVDSYEGSQMTRSELERNPNESRGFEFFQNDLFNEFFNEIAVLNQSETNKYDCLRQLSEIPVAIQRGDRWGLKFLDAWGKIPSGILWGHLTEFGNFDECVQIDHTLQTESSDRIQGQYCLTTIPFGGFFKNVSSDLSEVAKINLGICVPRTCDASYINMILSQKLSRLFNLTITSDIVTQSKCSTNTLPFDTIDWVAISFFSLIGFLVVCSTLYDMHIKRQGGIPKQLLAAFSLYTNVNLLFRTSSKKSPNIIGCLNGIRCLSIIWIIFGHSYFMTLLLPTSNSIQIVEWAQTPFSMILQRGQISVDTFFFLSGLLLIWSGMKEMEKTGGKINVPLMYLHRYIRLTPVMAASVLFFVSLFRHMGDGPLWKDFTNQHKLCHETWWATILYVQNYAAAGKMCLGHTWYLAVDMQLYILSPLILIPLFKWKKKAVGAVVLLGLLMVACVFTAIMVNNYTVFSKTGNLGADTIEMRKIYYSTHARTSPWFIGIIFGYFLYNHRLSRRKMSKVLVIGGWLVSLALLLSGIFSVYPKVLPGATPLTTLEGAFFLTLSRVAWPLALSWIVFACVNGYGGPVNTFLSWTFWQPMAKISYCMYIIHLMIETINGGRIKVNPYFSDYDGILKFWGDFGITVCVSIVAYLMFESPMMGIESSLLRSEKKKTTTNLAISNQGLCESSSSVKIEK